MRYRSVACMLVLALAVSVRAETFVIHAGGKNNEVVFESKAPMESFKGRTNQISGSIEADLSQLADSLSFRIEVDLASLDTGIGLRNQHMRDNHLETDTFPIAVFAGGNVESTTSPALTRGASATVRLAGELSLHGVTRPVEIDVNLTLAESGVLNVSGDFVINLSDHDIKRPKFLVLKLADEQKIHVGFTAQPVSMNASN